MRHLGTVLGLDRLGAAPDRRLSRKFFFAFEGVQPCSGALTVFFDEFPLIAAYERKDAYRKAPDCSEAEEIACNISAPTFSALNPFGERNLRPNARSGAAPTQTGFDTVPKDGKAPAHHRGYAQTRTVRAGRRSVF